MTSDDVAERDAKLSAALDERYKNERLCPHNMGYFLDGCSYYTCMGCGKKVASGSARFIEHADFSRRPSFR